LELENITEDTRDFAYVRGDMVALVEKVWVAHTRGDVKFLEAAKMELLRVWEKWLETISKKLLEILLLSR
jgi:hypothetical protein